MGTLPQTVQFTTVLIYSLLCGSSRVQDVKEKFSKRKTN